MIRGHFTPTPTLSSLFKNRKNYRWWSEERCSSHIGRSQAGKGSTRPPSITPLPPGRDTRECINQILREWYRYQPSWVGFQQGSFHPASPESIEWYWVWFWIKGIFKKIIHLLFDCARSLLLPRLFSSCGEQGLLCSCGVRSSYCGGLSFYRAWALGHTSFTCCTCGRGIVVLRL